MSDHFGLDGFEIRLDDFDDPLDQPSSSGLDPYEPLPHSYQGGNNQQQLPHIAAYDTGATAMGYNNNMSSNTNTRAFQYDTNYNDRSIMYPDPSHMDRQAPPPPVAKSQPAVSSGSASPDALKLRGSDIAAFLPDSIHFVCGCSGFTPLHNELFLELVRMHFTERLQDPAFYDLCGNRYPVRDEVQPILDKARQQSSIQDVRIWTVVGKHRLKESNWIELDFEDVTNNSVRCRERLESPLRSVLTKLYTGSTSSKTSRYPTAPGQSPSPVVSTSSVRSSPPSSLSQSAPVAYRSQTQIEPLPYQPLPPQTSLPPQQLQQQNHQEPNLRRSHQEMTVSPVEAGMFRQASHSMGKPSGPILPETDRSWELKGELQGLILYEDAMMTDLCEEFNKPNITHVASLSSVVDESMADQANTCLAKKVAKKWLDERPKSRWVCWIDASDPWALTTSYRQLVKKLQGAPNDSMEQASPKRRQLSPSAAATDFFNEYKSRFSSQFECLIVYVNVTHPEVFAEGFLPSIWLQDGHCQSTIRGIILSSPHPNYDGNMGPPFGNVVQHSIEWIPHWNETEKRFWWERLPQSNLPVLLDDVEEPQDIDRKLAYDGRALALIDSGREQPTFAGEVANQFARRWEMVENTERFSIWLRAGTEASLRESYRTAIRRVTHSTPQTPLGNPVDLSIRVIGDELMSILMKVRELSGSKQWIMVFADATHEEPFHKLFFSGKSNWWNSKGRFVITSTTDGVEVEVMNDGVIHRKKVAAIVCS